MLSLVNTWGSTETERAEPWPCDELLEAPHLVAWRAVDVVELPKAARYDGQELAGTGDAACKDIAAKRANGELKRSWSFERPTRAQWASGQRYGYCWVPEVG